jgi:hypothetical protein
MKRKEENPVDRLNRIIKDTCTRLLAYTEPSAHDVGDAAEIASAGAAQ